MTTTETIIALAIAIFAIAFRSKIGLAIYCVILIPMYVMYFTINAIAFLIEAIMINEKDSELLHKILVKIKHKFE